MGAKAILPNEPNYVHVFLIANENRYVVEVTMTTSKL
jgi:hypothetical protein